MKEHPNFDSHAVTIYLTNGVKLQGWYDAIKGDKTAFILTRDAVPQLVMMHAVATIMKTEEVQ